MKFRQVKTTISKHGRRVIRFNPGRRMHGFWCLVQQFSLSGNDNYFNNNNNNHNGDNDHSSGWRWRCSRRRRWVHWVIQKDHKLASAESKHDLTSHSCIWKCINVLHTRRCFRNRCSIRWFCNHSSSSRRSHNNNNNYCCSWWWSLLICCLFFLFFTRMVPARKKRQAATTTTTTTSTTTTIPFIDSYVEVGCSSLIICNPEPLSHLRWR